MKMKTLPVKICRISLKQNIGGSSMYEMPMLEKKEG
jgi:hypothetical protein